MCFFMKLFQNGNVDLGGGFKYCLFSPPFGEEFQFDDHIFQMGWFNHQPVMFFQMAQSKHEVIITK